LGYCVIWRDANSAYTLDAVAERANFKLERHQVLGCLVPTDGRKSYGHTPSLETAKAAFKAEYLAWLTQTTK
jgi:hypothetical protein